MTPVSLSHLPQCLLGITVFDVHISTVFCQAADADPAAQLPAFLHILVVSSSLPRIPATANSTAPMD
ncbi:hypothetical protein TYRP_010552 [Tyrophagus putrescentiae]|nr:hypothetical protein TYRP_010552 [Tyrophagus putrescentiae]